MLLRLKWNNQAQFAGVYVAQEKGFYKKAGLEVSHLKRDFSKNIAPEVASGAVQFGIVSSNEFLEAIKKGQRVVALGAIFQKTPTIIVSLKEKNIFEPKDLIGKRVAVGNNAIASKFMETLFFSAGLGGMKADLVEVNSSQIEALLQGQADAAIIFRTNELFELNQKGVAYNIIYPENYNVRIYDDILITSADFRDRNPKIVESFLKATIEGWQYVYKNREEALNITLKYADIDYQDKDLQNYILENSMPLIAPDGPELIGSIAKDKLDKIYSSLYKEGAIESPDLYHSLSPMYFLYQ